MELKIMLLQRRSFMGLIIGAAASGTLLTSPTVAQAILTVPTDRVTETVRRGRELNTLFGILKSDSAAKNLISPTRSEIYDEFLVTSNALIEWMLNTYPETPDAAGVKALFENQSRLNAFDEVELRTIAEPIIPIAVTKHCIQVGMPFDTRRMPAFDDFAQRYRDQIMG